MATLGQQLKAAREAKGISEQDAGTATKILTKIIVAIEADDFSGIAAPTYAKGFIRLYAGYLGLDPEPLVEEYMSRHVSAPRPRLEEKKQPQKSPGLADAPAAGLKGLTTGLHLKEWPGSISQFFSRLGSKVPPVKDVRIAAAGAAGLLVLIVLIISISNCARRRAAETPAPQAAEAPARQLINGDLPDLYLVEPGKMESSQ